MLVQEWVDIFQLYFKAYMCFLFGEDEAGMNKQTQIARHH